MRIHLMIVPLMVVLIGAVGLKLKLSEEIPNPSSVIVDLSGKDLKEIPLDYKEKILKAEILLLDGNNLTELPLWLKEATLLKRISINNNPQFDFFKFTVDFQEMTHLEELSASNCNLVMIPYQLTFFTNLKKLDLSYNSILEVPYHFSFLTSLTKCDLSNNRINQVGYSFRDLKKLKSLDVSGNTDLNVKDLCSSLEGKVLDELKLEIKDTLPESLVYVEVAKLDLTTSSNTKWGTALASMNFSDLTVRNKNGDNSLSKDMLQQLAVKSNLNNLAFIGFTIQEIPSQLIHAKNLKSLDVSASRLNSTIGLEKMISLKNLNVKENSLTLEQVQDLKTKLPSCNIQSDEEKLNGSAVSYTITPPIEELKVETEKIIVDPKKESEFVSSSGETTLDIPANAFLDSKGKIVTAPVEIRFKEYNDPLSVALSGIPMQIKNADGTSGDFNSAGMFELNAFANGEPVYPNPKALITANIISKQTTPYNLYSYTDGRGWELMQSEPITPELLAPSSEAALPASGVGSYNSGFKNLTFYDTSLTKRKYIAHPKIQYDLKKKASEKSFRIQFYSPLMYTKYGDVSSRYPINVPDEYKTVLSQPLLYNGNNYENDFKLMDTIRKSLKKVYMEKGTYKRYKKNGKRVVKYKYAENVLLKNVTLSPDTKNDDYVLSFNYRGENHKIHVIPEGEGNSAAKIQEQNKKFYQNYLFAKNKYDKAFEKVLAEYKEDVQKAQDSLSKVLAEKNINLSEAREAMASSGKAIYSLQVASFGIVNCDVVGRMIKPKAVRLTFKDILGKALIFFQMIRIDLKNNSITYVGPDEPLMIDYGHDQTALLFVMANHQIGIVSADDLKLHRDDSSMDVKVVDTDSFTPKKVRAML